MSLGKVRKWFGQILYVTIPTFLLQKLTYCYEKVRLWRKLHPTIRAMSGEELKVYDLVNCGPQHRFQIGATNAYIVHNCSYGASANKIRQTLSLQGIDISHTEAKQMFDRYWKLFAAVKEYEKFLLAQWERSGGWFLNPIGRPICVAQDYLKDIINRSIQSGGHDCFILFLSLMTEVLKRHKIQYAPYIWDIHDCVMLEVPEDQAMECKKLLDGEVLEEVNYFLDGKVKLKGDANVVDNWAQDKFEG